MNSRNPGEAPKRPRPDGEAASTTVTPDDLRVIAAWAAECAERVLPIFESRATSDTRPREAIEGARAFADGGSRIARLRSLVWAAYAAARDVGDPAAAAAARAAGLAAGVAYTHAEVTAPQTKHVFGPAAYAALARELAEAAEPGAADAEVAWAIGHASFAVRDLIRLMPSRESGRGRPEGLLHQLGAGLRGGSPTSDA